MKTILTLALGLVLGYCLSTSAEVLSCNFAGQCQPVQPPAGWAPYTESQRQQQNWQLQQNFNNALLNQRNPC